ncbi:hypothetical protein [Spirosoma rigui]|uniref:hypothetical protein n=1 Tax=Spirosoma rigui TaxID=564064 RepID=UPI0009AFED70|nr:hypothetical protein [Spirosoma rigui]
MSVLTSTIPKNPIARLLGALPARVAEEKDRAIQQELMAVGLWQHYRQNIAKQEVDLGRMAIRGANIIKIHLGVSDDFFTKGREVQDEEIQRIIAPYYEQVLKN